MPFTGWPQKRGPIGRSVGPPSTYQGRARERAKRGRKLPAIRVRPFSASETLKLTPCCVRTCVCVFRKEVGRAGGRAKERAAAPEPLCPSVGSRHGQSLLLLLPFSARIRSSECLRRNGFSGPTRCVRGITPGPGSCTRLRKNQGGKNMKLASLDVGNTLIGGGTRDRGRLGAIFNLKNNWSASVRL